MNVAAILKSKGRDVVTTTSEMSLLDVAKLLEQQGIGCIVIAGDDGKVAGIVSERDILQGLGRDGAEILNHPVAAIMTNDTITCTSADAAELVMSLMTRLRVRHIPVTEAGRLIGIVSIGDIVRHRLEQIERENEQIRDYITTGR